MYKKIPCGNFGNGGSGDLENGKLLMTTTHSQIEITMICEDEDPIVFYFIPSGFRGMTIKITEDPIWGTDCILVNEEELKEILQKLGFPNGLPQERKEKTEDRENDPSPLDMQQLIKAVKTMLRPLNVEERKQYDAVASTIALFISAKAKEYKRMAR